MTGGSTRVGLFGMLGSGNIGNDTSMESMLRYLRSDHPDAIVDAMCSGPERVRDRYGIQAVALSWYSRHEQSTSGLAAIALKVAGKGLDSFRIASWVRRHDVVIIPGMGVLETTLPLRALGAPLALFLVCASGRLFRTKVALVSVGANVTRRRLMRLLYSAAPRLACYCSYRDAYSREALRRSHGRTPGEVYPDLAFAIPVAAGSPGDPDVVGVGVMDFHGSDDERQHASEIYESYVEQMKAFILWLVDSGKTVRLFVGDTKGCDDAVVDRLLAELRADRPALPASQVSAAQASSFGEVVDTLRPVGAVIAARYHNVISALRLCKPTISVGYAAKHDAVMAQVGLADFCQRANALDVERLIEQFKELQVRAPELRAELAKRNEALAAESEVQFAELSSVLFPAAVRDGQLPAQSRSGSRVASRAGR
jgi:polysaccharide pyruvyl transferase WcaK-like protein